MAAPTVLILAAGQGTRMRSNTPKVLHELCGRPMVLWPVQAALQAGAGRVVVVDSPGGTLEPVSAAHIMPIGSFIGATVPLGADSNVLPGGESVDDSRFVVRYFRKTKDNRLLFGGREIYSSEKPNEIADHIRRQVSEIYPALAFDRQDNLYIGDSQNHAIRKLTRGGLGGTMSTLARVAAPTGLAFDAFGTLAPA